MYVTSNKEKYLGYWNKGEVDIQIFQTSKMEFKRESSGRSEFHFHDEISKYTGSWENVMKNGYGVYIWPQGKRKYEGSFSMNQIHGYGKLLLENGTSYTGLFKNNERHGHGVQVFSDGSTFNGHFVDGKMLKGTMRYAVGHKY